MKFLSLAALAISSVNAIKITEQPVVGNGEGNNDGTKGPDLFGETINGVANFKSTETTLMFKSNKTMAGLVYFYDPAQVEENKDLVKEWVKVGEEMNQRGTGVRIEAVNTSWTADKASLGITKFPAFKLFRFGDDQKGEDVPEKVVKAGKKGDFVKYLADKGYKMGEDAKKPKPSAPAIPENIVNEDEE